MNWQHLKYFAAVSQEEHFTRAAAKLYVAQSTLSKAMDSLEKEIGVPLFEKQGRNVKLTPFGKVLKEEAIGAIAKIDGAIEQINDMAKSESGLIRAASIFTMGTNYIPLLLNEYMKKYSKVHLDYTQKATRDIIQDVLDENIDVGFCGEFIFNERLMDLNRTVVKIEELILAVPVTHRLAGQNSIRMADILDETFVGWHLSTGIQLSIKNCLKESMIETELKANFSATEDNTVTSMVRSGLGIALIADVDSINFDGLHKLTITDVAMKRNLYMIWKKDRPLTTAVRSFILYTSGRPVV